MKFQCVRNLVFAGSMLLVIAPGATAQPYPEGPVRVVVPFAPGGTMDIVGRIISNKLSDHFGKNFIVDNRAGAGGVIGTDIVAKAAPSGYTLLAFHSGLAYNASLYKKLPFDTLRDIAPVSQVGGTPSLLLLNPSFKAGSVKEVIALAKASPGSINYSTAGIGSTTHLAMALLENMAGIKLQAIPYKGGALAMTSVISGETQLMVGTMPGGLPHIKSGKLKALAITSTKRSDVLPEIPTVAESGVRGYDYVTWYGIFAPSGTPKKIVDQLNKAINDLLAKGDLKEDMRRQGIDPGGGSVEAFSKHFRLEVERWSKVIKETGIQAQ